MPPAAMRRTLKGETGIRISDRRLGKGLGERTEQMGEGAQEVSYGGMKWGRKYLAWRW